MNNIKRKYKTIDSFLKFWKEIAKENLNIDFNSDSIKNSIYKSLVRVGVNQKEAEVDLSLNGIFDNFCNCYKNKENIRVFVSPNWKYFCQFQNKPECFDYGKSEAIKIYISLDSKHIEQGTKNIFNFLQENNIAFMGKVGRNIRVDDVVVRLSNENDARRLLDFVKKDKYIQSGLIDANQFAFNQNNIAMACDRRMSYNSTISSLIAIYLENSKRENNLEQVNISHFIKFVTAYYQERFINFNSIEETLYDFKQDKNINDLTEEDKYFKIVNIKEILTLFLKTMNNEFEMKNIFEHYEENKKNIRKNIEILKEKNKLNKYKQNTKQTVEESIIDKYFYEIIKTFKEKEYSKDHMYKVLEAYLKTGERNYLTSTNDLRNKIDNSNFRQETIYYLNEHKINLKELFENKLNLYNEKILEEAVIKTYKKYQQQYLENKISIDGEQWVIGSLGKIIFEKVYNGFTRDDNIREILIKNISQDDLIEIIKRKANINLNTSLTKEEYLELIRNYFNQIYKDKIFKEEKTRIF